MGGQSGANVAAGAVLANSATNANTASQIVKRDASGNFSAGTITAGLSGNTQAAISLSPFGVAAGATGEVRFKELAANGSNYVALKAPDSIGSDTTLTLPSSNGTNGQVLNTDGSGNLGWISAASGTVTSIATSTGLSGGTITGSGTIALADTAVSPGSYTRATITVDAQGRLTAAANGAAVNLGTADVTGSLPDSNLSTISSAGKVANSATTATSANTANTIVLRDASGNFSAGSITAALTGNVSGNAGTVTNGVYTNVSYNDPDWITHLDGEKINGEAIPHVIYNNAGDQTIVPEENDEKGLIIKGRGGQTANLQEWQNSSGTVQASVGPTGIITGVGSGLTGIPAANLTGTVAIATGGTGSATGSITGTGALTFTAGGSNTNVNLAPNGSGTVDVASKRITSVATPTAGTDAANKTYVDAILPSQTGNSDKFLTTNGSAASWATLGSMLTRYSTVSPGVHSDENSSNRQCQQHASLDILSVAVAKQATLMT